jgi:hypothetical protein
MNQEARAELASRPITRLSGLRAPQAGQHRAWRLVEDERAAYRTFAGRGRLAALIYYSWSGDYVGQKESPGTLFRCGALTEAGKLALSPM